MRGKGCCQASCGTGRIPLAAKKIAQSQNVNNAKLGKTLAEAWKLRWLEREKEKKRRQTMSTYWGIRVALHTSLRKKLIA